MRNLIVVFVVIFVVLVSMRSPQFNERVAEKNSRDFAMQQFGNYIIKRDLLTEQDKKDYSAFIKMSEEQRRFVGYRNEYVSQFGSDDGYDEKMRVQQIALRAHRRYREVSIKP